MVQSSLLTLQINKSSLSALFSYELFAALSVSFNLGLGHWEKESKRLSPYMWSTTMKHDTSAGYSYIRSLGPHSFDVRNVCVHSSGLLLFAPKEDEDDSAAALEHMLVYLVTVLPSSIIDNTLFHLSSFEVFFSI